VHGIHDQCLATGVASQPGTGAFRQARQLAYQPVGQPLVFRIERVPERCAVSEIPQAGAARCGMRPRASAAQRPLPAMHAR